MQNRQNKQNKIITIIGKKGYGKTIFTEMLILLNNRPCIIADPRYQYPTDCKRRLFFKNPHLLSLWLSNIKNYRDFYNYNLECVCSCGQENFEKLAQTVYQMKNMTFCIDEIDMFYNAYTSNNSYINKIIQYGRHYLIDVITTSRRPANIGRNLTAMSDMFYFTRITEPRDIKYIKETKDDESFLKKIQELQKYNFLELREDGSYSIVRTNNKDINIIDRL
jgi:hypothetical protein